MTWRSIKDDPPPKDGTAILLLVEGKAIQAAWCNPSWGEGFWEVVSLPSHGCGCCSDNNEEPTAWHPLPDA